MSNVISSIIIETNFKFLFIFLDERTNKLSGKTNECSNRKLNLKIENWFQSHALLLNFFFGGILCLWDRSIIIIDFCK